MEKLFSLGEIYVSDFLKPDEFAKPERLHELELVMDKSIGAARLKTTKPLGDMFGKYWYRSGTNASMKAALKNVVDSILPFVYYGPNDGVLRLSRWLDIASNDGTLLSLVPNTFSRLGFDPCEGDIYEQAKKHADIIQGYFNPFTFRITGERFNVITTIAMFYDLEDPDTFIKDVYEVLDDEGLWVLQLSYTPLMLKQLAFDNILSEHVFYHTLGSMKTLLERNGFRIVDCTLNDVNGGSMRVFVRKEKASVKNFGTQAYRDVCNYRIESLLSEELSNGVSFPEVWQNFHRDILKLKAEVVDFITYAKKRGKTVMGYGASTKGNTLLQFFGLDHTMIDAIAERQECKWGLKTIGTNIPIISEQEMRERKPDYLLILPWHFIQSFEEREAEYLNNGGKMIVTNPVFIIIEK